MRDFRRKVGGSGRGNETGERLRGLKRLSRHDLGRAEGRRRSDRMLDSPRPAVNQASNCRLQFRAAQEFAFTMASLELEKLTKRYPGVVSVDAIDLSVMHGEFVCLLGPSGCGKTTTLRMIAGFIAPDGGEIRVGGNVVSSTASVVPPEQRNMSMVFQS